MTQPALGANHSNFAFLSDYDPLFLQLAQSVVRAFAYFIEQAAQATINRMNNLPQSMLAKAFRGELTADWRPAYSKLIGGENSTEVLLAKIKLERAKLSQTKKG